MSCAQRGIDSQPRRPSISRPLGKACRVASSPPTVCTRGTPIAIAGSTGPRTFGPSLPRTRTSRVGRDARLGCDGQRPHDGPPQSRRGPRSGRLTRSSSGATPARIKAVSETSRRPRWRYRARTHLHSLHFNALVVTSVAISARFSTGPGQVAQLAEHAAENRGVGSSILPLATTEGAGPGRAGASSGSRGCGSRPTDPGRPGRCRRPACSRIAAGPRGPRGCRARSGRRRARPRS